MELKLQDLQGYQSFPICFRPILWLKRAACGQTDVVYSGFCKSIFRQKCIKRDESTKPMEWYFRG